MPDRRFPPPWIVEELDACYVVRDHDGQKLAYVYYEEERTLGGQVAHQGRGAADRSRHRQAALTETRFKRLGRKLRPKDFLRDHPFNEWPGTPRLLKRRGVIFP